MKLNLNKKLNDLEGNPIEGPSMGRLLANTLIMKAYHLDKVKAYDWAIKLHKNEEIEIDNADKGALLRFIDCEEMLTVLGKVQIRKEIDGLGDK